MPTAPEILTTAEVAEILGVTPKRVQQLDSELRPYMTGSGQRLFLREVVEAVAGARDARASKGRR